MTGIGMFLTALVAIGGGLVSANLPLAGYPLVAIGALGLGVFIARLQRGLWSGNKYAGGLMTDTLFNTMVDDPAIAARMRVYLAAPQLMPASGLYVARVDGERVLVIEKGESNEAKS